MGLAVPEGLRVRCGVGVGEVVPLEVEVWVLRVSEAAVRLGVTVGVTVALGESVLVQDAEHVRARVRVGVADLVGLGVRVRLKAAEQVALGGGDRERLDVRETLGSGLPEGEGVRLRASVADDGVGLEVQVSVGVVETDAVPRPVGVGEREGVPDPEGVGVREAVGLHVPDGVGL